MILGTAQGSVGAALNSSGSTTAAQLYAPYGSLRYASGTMPTDYGYTGQRADSATGLDYYGARYYDPAGGQFASADTASDGLNRYGYVGGNPTTATDPSGHYTCYDDPCTKSGAGTDTTPPPPPSCAPNCPPPPPPPSCSPTCNGGKHCAGANPKMCSGTPGSGDKAKARQMPLRVKVRLSVSLPWWDASHLGDWILAGLVTAGGIALVVAGIAAQPEDPLGLVMFINGLDLIIHGLELMAKIIWGVHSWQYQVLLGLAVVLDAVVVVVDVIALSVLLGPAAEAGIWPMLQANSQALALLGTLMGVDFGALWNDFLAYRNR